MLLNKYDVEKNGYKWPFFANFKWGETSTMVFSKKKKKNLWNLKLIIFWGNIKGFKQFYNSKIGKCG